MSLSKDKVCNGVEPFNFRDTGDTVATLTANVGQSTAIGPKVTIKFKRKGNEMSESKSMTGKLKEKFSFLEEDETAIVRRLTPTCECARLMGFPDKHLVPMGGDSAQYKGAGNSWAVNCARWVMSRIHIVSRMLGKEVKNYGTVCSGVEAHSLSVEGFGDKAVFFSEIEKPQGQLLKTHWPDVPNFGDFTKIHLEDEKGILTNCLRDGEKDELPSMFYHAPVIEVPFKRGELDILSGGIPCTDVSVAGKREGMAEGSGTRSSLAFNYQKLIDDLEPRFVVYENVPGIFSSNGGKDFIWFVSKIMNSGYTVAWRTLDAQYVMTDKHPRAVPQRRRRLWLVAYRGNDWRIPSMIVHEQSKFVGSISPDRIPGKGFQTLNPDFVEDENSVCKTSQKSRKSKAADDMFGNLFENIEEEKNDSRKMSQIISKDEYPGEGDITKLPDVSLYQFCRTLGDVGYCGGIFTNGEANPDFINPAICDNIGNAGIMANGKICTLTCNEWTSGIQLSPDTVEMYESGNAGKDDVFPEAYDGTVCGLSDVLEDEVDDKYNLSWRACYGILSRASKRGKELPVALEVALILTIIENAGIVKWVVLNGRDTKKKETDMTERELAKDCYDKYIEEEKPFDTVEAVEPKRNQDDDEEDDEELDEEELEGADLDEEFGLPKTIDDGKAVDDISGESDGDVDDLREAGKKTVKCVDTKLDSARVEEEVAPTLLATSHKEPPAIVK